MKKAKPSSRVVGVVYFKPKNLWRIRYMINGESRDEYRTTKEAAEARALELGANFSGADGAPGSDLQGTTRAEWLVVLWDQVCDVRKVDDPKLRINGLDAIARAYNVIREDLQALEQGTAKAEDPTKLSDEELESKLIQLKAVSNG